MDINKILLLIFSYYKNKMVGKTTVQKRMYFLSDFLSKDFGFHHYYYGPFSNLVNQAIDYNCGLRFLKEELIFFPPDQKRYDYELTEDGKKFVLYLRSNGEKEIAKKLEKFHKLMIQSGDTQDDYNLLSWAAKIHYIKKNNQIKTLNHVQIIQEKLINYGWKLNNKEIQSGIEFLKIYEKEKGSILI